MGMSPEVKIKALVWEPLQRRSYNIGARTPFGTYCIERFSQKGPYWVRFGSGWPRQDFETQEAARAHVEAEYKAKALEMIDTSGDWWER